MALIQSAVKDGKPWKEFNKNNAEKPIKAIKVETEEIHLTQSKLIFTKLYGSTVTHFPLAQRLRYVPSIEPDTPSHLRA